MILHARPAGQAHPRLGAHISIAGGFARAVDRAVATDCEAVQIFSKSSNQWRARALTDAEVRLFRQRVADTEVEPIVAHASYLINLASPDPKLRRRSTDALEDELQRANSLGLAGVVLHPGAYTTSSEDEGLARIADAITDVLARHPPDRPISSWNRPLVRAQCSVTDSITCGRSSIALMTRRSWVCVWTPVTWWRPATTSFHPTAMLTSSTNSRRSLGSTVSSCFTSTTRSNRSVVGSTAMKPSAAGTSESSRSAVCCVTNRFRDLPMVLETPKSGRGAPSSLEADPMDIQNLTLLRQLR